MRNAAPHSGGMESVLLWRERVSWPRNSFWSVWRRRVGVALKGSDISWDSLLKLQMQARWGYSQAIQMFLEEVTLGFARGVFRNAMSWR